LLIGSATGKQRVCSMIELKVKTTIFSCSMKRRMMCSKINMTQAQSSYLLWTVT
jgi:hypothetical protein